MSARVDARPFLETVFVFTDHLLYTSLLSALSAIDFSESEIMDSSLFLSHSRQWLTLQSNRTQ